jgi:hypothetical protein
MSFMKKRWLIYILIGALFGVFDFYYQEFAQAINTSNIILSILTLGIWLVPVVPVALYEARTSVSRVRSALASIITWSVAIISYYLFLVIKLVFIGQAMRPEMHISQHADPFYWENLKSVLIGDFFLGGVAEWIVVVFPAPFGPSKPNTSPSATEKLRLSTAVVSPNFLVRFLTSIMFIFAF